MIKKLLVLSLSLTCSAIVFSQCTEVLVNGHFDSSADTGWTKTLDTNNPGNPSDVMLLSTNVDFSGTQKSGADAVAFSYDWVEQTQTIDLVAGGYSTSALDTAPEITVSEWYKGLAWSAPNFDDSYYYLAELLDASDAVIDSYALGSKASPVKATDAWQEVSHSFTAYGAGLRKIRITHGGNDKEDWAGNYGVVVDDSSVCVDNSALSISESELLSKNVSVYPNPNNGEVKITLNNDNFDNATINIYSLTGQKIYSAKNIISKTHKFDLNVSKGIYQVEINNKSGKAYKKLIVK